MTNLSEKQGGGLIYSPAMMDFSASGNYETTLTTTGNKVTCCGRFKRGTFTGTGEFLFYINGFRAAITLTSSDDADSGSRGRLSFRVQNSGATNICWLWSDANLLDDELHTWFAAFDGDAGTGIFYIDGALQSYSGSANYVAPITGTLQTGASQGIRVGNHLTLARPFLGQLGFVGHSQAYLTNWQDFMTGDGYPKQLDEFGWTQWGGGTFGPASQTFDGSTGSFASGYTVTTSGNKVTVVGRFKRASFTGGISEYIARCTMTGVTYARFGCYLLPSDFATTDIRNKFVCFTTSSTGAVLAALPSISDFTDGQWHTFMYSFDGDTGSGQLIVDGQDEIWTGASNYSAPTTGTLATATQKISVGVNQSGGGYLDGEISFFGYQDAYLTNWGDFMDANGVPQEIDELNWTEWGGQPLFWHKYCAMDDNKGSAGNLTRNGTVTHTPNSQPLFWNKHGDMVSNAGSVGAMTKNGTIVIGDGGAGPFPQIGLPTIGTAVAADIATGKTAWVDGVELVGSGGFALPGDLLLFHQFDGSNGALVGGVKPSLCYDDTTAFSVSGSPALNGNGYLVAAANNNIVIVDPETRWPSRAGKTRIYEFWGRYAAAPSSAADYMPQVRINYVDASNFWTARVGHGTNAAYNEQFEWIGGVLGESNSSTSASMLGAFRWCLRIEDQGDQVLSMCTIQRESTEASDLDITQSPAVQLHKTTRPNQSEALFQFRWESVSNYANCQLRGMAVYDR